MTRPIQRKEIISTINNTIRSTNDLKKSVINQKIENIGHEIFNQLNDAAQKLKDQITELANYRRPKFFIIKFFLWIADSSQNRKINKEVAKINAFIAARQLRAPEPKVEPKPESQPEPTNEASPKVEAAPSSAPGVFEALYNMLPDVNTVGQAAADAVVATGQAATTATAATGAALVNAGAAVYQTAANVGGAVVEGIANVGAQVSAMASPLLPAKTPAAPASSEPAVASVTIALTPVRSIKFGI